MINSDRSEVGDRSHETSVNGALSTVREAEREYLKAWNATQQEYPRDACVQQLVAMQAAATPGAVALVAGETVLSYSELNRQANQLAHYLQSLGVGPNVLVGLYMERSVEMVVGLLGILKANGAYLPLDPNYPAERLAFMLEDARTSVLVTQKHLLSRLPTQEGIQVVCLDKDANELARQSTVDPTCAVTIDDLAYVVYTSGSTGQPKGAQIIHDGLLNLVFWHQRAFAVTSADRATQVTSPAFDATGWELWPYLTCGASVYVLDDEIRSAPLLLRNWLIKQGITISFLSTALAEGVMALEWPRTSSLRFLLTGADTLHHYPSPDLPFRLINNYGLSEATVVNTSGPILPLAQADTLPDTPPSIGRPIANTQIYILDEYLRDVPIGVPGELYLGGAGVGRGYLNRPELTDERFITDPFSTKPGAKMYKTGDLAYYLPDGQIAFMGRADQQVKIRGFRIELDEIVARLNIHPAIQTSLVIAREDASGEKRLVAYIVLHPETQITAQTLREGLMTHLPDYMIPTAFVQLEALPLTANGKVDRLALPAPAATNTLREREVAAPGTPMEERIAGIVAALLGVEQVGIDDNFFMLGGHSLLGTQVIMQVASTFDVSLTLRTLFEAPTVRQLSAEVERLIFVKVEAMSNDEVLQLLEERNR